MPFVLQVAAFAGWWSALFVVQLAAWPAVFAFFRRLPDRGMAFARMAGLGLVGYLFWMGGILRLWPNAAGSAWIAVCLVLALGWTWCAHDHLEPWTWLRQHRKAFLSGEAVFLLAFALWAWVRANNPDATGTEKPMELAFINAILHSSSFPPNDPWLSGYAISYYHFGYILVGMLAKMAAVTGGQAFNLAVASWFGMAALGSYGLLRNLLALVTPGTRERLHSLTAALWAPFALLLVGNLGGILEVLHNLGIGWGNGQGGFWRWLDILDLSSPPSGPPTLNPLEYRFWWWWRSSRVINDLDLMGRSISLQPIDEFPAFSFVLGDLHPHVLALPFGFVALAFGLEMLLRLADRQGAGNALAEAFALPTLIGGGLLVGGLAFLNTWDFPIYLGVCAAASWLGWRAGRPPRPLRNLALRWAEFSLIAVGLYIPFYVGFASQAGGVVPNLVFVTRGQQWLVMFAPLVVPIAFWLTSEAWAARAVASWKAGVLLGLSAVFGLFAFSLLLGGILIGNPTVQVLAQEYIQPLTIREAILVALGRRLMQPGTALSLAAILALCSALVVRRGNRAREAPGEPAGASRAQGPGLAETGSGARPAHDFVLLLIAAGALLVLTPEYLYLRDQFGVRMNTIFKFYFEAWAFWSLAAAFGVVMLWQAGRSESSSGQARGLAQWFSLVGASFTVGVMALGFVYTPLAVWTKTGGFHPYGGATLDASAYLRWQSPADAAAIAWIRANLQEGPISEAVGGEYTEFARVSTQTGIPTVLGWPGHEGQWRGGYNEVGSREDDIRELYRSTDWQTAQAILQRYHLRYVYFGTLEQESYGTAGLAKFRDHLPEVYHSEQVSIFDTGMN